MPTKTEAKVEEAKVEEEKVEETKKLTPNDPGYWDEKISYKPFYDGAFYKDDIYVAVNGENRVIKRDIDEPVMLERKFVQAIKDAEEQQRAARRYQLAHINNEV